MIRFHNCLRRFREDDGLTIVEISVAIGIFAVVMILFTTMLAGSLRGILLGKQRSVATANAESLLEAARDADFDQIGLAQPVNPPFDPPTEPGVVQDGPDWSYVVGQQPADTEPIVFVTDPDPIFHPRIQDDQTGSTELTRYVYVTGIDENNDGTIDAKRVIVRVVIDRPGQAGPSDEVRLQTVISSTGSLPGALPPISGIARAAGSWADVAIATTGDTLEDPTHHLNLQFSQSEGKTRVVTVSRVECVSSTPSTGTAAGASASVIADNDPSTPVPPDPPPDSTTTTTPGLPSPFTGSSSAAIAECAADATDLPEGDGAASTSQDVSIAYPLAGLGLNLSVLGLSNSLQVLSSGLSEASNRLFHTQQPADDPGARQVNFEARSAHEEIRVLGGSALGLNFTQGLLRVEPHEITSTAWANAGPSCTPPLPDQGCSGDAESQVGDGFDVFIFDPAGQADGCSRRAGSYCVLEIRQSTLNAATSVTGGGQASLLGHTVLLSTEVDIGTPTSTTAAPTPGGEMYQSFYEPVTATINLTISGSLGPILEVEVEFSLGEVLARACHGIASGASGCL